MWLFAYGPEEHSDAWVCSQCETVTDLILRDESPAVSHVRDTGHNVYVEYKRDRMIFAVATDVMPA